MCAALRRTTPARILYNQRKRDNGLSGEGTAGTDDPETKKKDGRNAVPIFPAAGCVYKAFVPKFVGGRFRR